jgi:nucleotide-binding universal stress UspA family protein
VLVAVDDSPAAGELRVIGRHGTGHSGGPFLGSVAEFLLRNGSGPVLLAAGPPPEG